jgi:hypothetical protein
MGKKDGKAIGEAVRQGLVSDYWFASAGGISEVLLCLLNLRSFAPSVLLFRTGAPPPKLMRAPSLLCRSQDGSIVWGSETNTRVSTAASNLVFVSGTNKIVPTEADAFRRLTDYQVRSTIAVQPCVESR